MEKEVFSSPTRCEKWNALAKAELVSDTDSVLFSVFEDLQQRILEVI